MGQNHAFSENSGKTEVSREIDAKYVSTFCANHGIIIFNGQVENPAEQLMNNR